jgi:peptidoglycan/xylan/chitin deacetylase (PgdA/CDA1 family)
MVPMLFVTSWDDGHPDDLRIADMLERHGFRGTFFVPGRNAEGRAVLTLAERRQLHAGFEIGSHTLDHVYLPPLDAVQRRHQIVAGKDALEQQLGEPVAGFCYPGGHYDRHILREVASSGFRYARTIENFRIDAGTAPFAIPTSAQFYPHRRHVLAVNLIKRGQYSLRKAGAAKLMGSGDWQARMERFARLCAERDGVFHLWGHSWEISQFDLWAPLDRLLAAVAGLRPRVATVGEMAKDIRGSAT